jgi:hypothetical protein
MTRVRMDLFTSLDGYVPSDATSENPMGTGWGQLTAAWTSTRTFRRNLGDSSGSGTTGIDDRYAAAFIAGIGAEIMGAGMFGFASAAAIARLESSFGRNLWTIFI